MHKLAWTCGIGLVGGQRALGGLQRSPRCGHWRARHGEPQGPITAFELATGETVRVRVEELPIKFDRLMGAARAPGVRARTQRNSAAHGTRPARIEPLGVAAAGPLIIRVDATHADLLAAASPGCYVRLSITY